MCSWALLCVLPRPWVRGSDEPQAVWQSVLGSPAASRPAMEMFHCHGGWDWLLC